MFDLHFLHAADVRVVAERAGGFRRVETLEDHAHLACGAVHHEALLRAVGAAAHVDARHLHRRRLRQQREVVARGRQRRQLCGAEGVADLGGGGVDDRRLTGDRHRLLQGRHLQRGVHRGGESKADADALISHVGEAGQLEDHDVLAGRDRGEAIGAVGVGHRRARAHLVRARDRDGNTGHHGIRRVGHPAIDGAGTRRDSLAECERRGQQEQRQDKRKRTTHRYPPGVSTARWTNDDGRAIWALTAHSAPICVKMQAILTGCWDA